MTDKLVSLNSLTIDEVDFETRIEYDQGAYWGYWDTMRPLDAGNMTDGYPTAKACFLGICAQLWEFMTVEIPADRAAHAEPVIADPDNTEEEDDDLDS